MTPKERVLKAIAHREPDRVPTGEWWINGEVAEKVLGRETFFGRGGSLRYCQALWDGRRDEIIESMKKDTVELVLKLGLDTALPVSLVIGKNTPIEKPKQLDHETWETPGGDILKFQEPTQRLMIVKRAEKPPTPPAAPKPAEPPKPFEPDESELELAKYVIEKLGKTHFIFGGAFSSHPTLAYSSALGNMEHWCKIAEDPDAAGERAKKGAEQAFPVYERTARYGLDGMCVGSDFGHNTGPFISPNHFRRGVLPGLKAAAANIHKLGKVVLMHSCGNNRLLMDMFVEAGIDVYQAIQPQERIEEMKGLWGDRMTLWGGVYAGTLVLGKLADVRREVRCAVERCKRGGGFILGTSHSVMPGATYENYMAMLDELQKCGRY